MRCDAAMISLIFLVAPNDDSGDTHVNHNLQITQYRDGEVMLNWVECVR